MTTPTQPLKTRLEDIISRRENPTALCEQHPAEVAVSCRACASERIADRDADRDAWMHELASAECDRRFPFRYVQAEPDHPDVAEWVDRYRRELHTAPSLLILGDTGTGKTHQAYGALRAAVTQPQSAKWVAATCADLYASLRPRPGVDTEAALDTYRAAGLLLLDDLGAAKPSEWTEEVTYRVLNHRYEQCLPGIYTSNLAPGELRTVLGDRITSRLSEMCQRVVLDGGDRRRSA